MVIGCAISGPMGRRRDSISQKNGENLIVIGVVLRFIKGYLVSESPSKRTANLLKSTNVLFMKFELLSSGVRNDLAHFAAVVTEVSWPSFAAEISIRNSKLVKDELMLGVMNIHCGSLLLLRSVSNIVKFLIFARRSTLDVTES